MFIDPENLSALSDRELIGREAADRCRFLLIPRADPRASGTTYRVIGVASVLLDAWKCWMASSHALTRRGLLPQRPINVVNA
jgi:hypothetical protein